ncbi:hypothetical protein [Rossellomorea vietnamensis]|uniref:hypothetical protein n=1 Tax=Rossellomorea vietnamensis TaxID=218284 RepID=UPI001653C671|nr:hypothetical protein [Rossellomorea vietnamensis]
MNSYVKQMVNSRVEYLEMEEREVKERIEHTKADMKTYEEKLKGIREEIKELKRTDK